MPYMKHRKYSTIHMKHDRKYHKVYFQLPSLQYTNEAEPSKQVTHQSQCRRWGKPG